MRDRLKSLLAPPVFPDDEEKTRVASLLNILLLALMAIFVANTLVALFFNPDPAAFWLNAGTILLTAALLTTLRLRYVRAASLLMLTLFWAIVAGIALFLTGLSITIVTSFFVLIVLASALAGSMTTVIFVLLTLLVGGITAYLQLSGRLIPPLAGDFLVNVTSAAGNLLAMAVVLSLTSAALQRALAKQRENNLALAAAQSSLESRVSARTRDLALAAEVGRRMSEIQDRDTLLQVAVNLIQERFNLYYVQVYLVMPAQHILRLRAGTGTVGAALVRQRHALPIGPGSINGIAAGQKRSILVADTTGSQLFRANPLLPDTRSELAVPLLVEDRLLGVLNVQASQRDLLTEDNMLAFEILANQMATALDNAALFAEARAARANAEAYLRRLTREGWQAYLNAVDRPQRIGYLFDQQELKPINAALTPIAAETNALQVPIQLVGEAIGMIQVEADDGRSWDSESLDLVTAVAQRVAQQVENLRLLEDAQRFQAEAQAAIRRLTSQAWHEEQARQPDLLGYLFDGQQVRPLEAGDQGAAADPPPGVREPLIVRGESIASLELVTSSEADRQLVTAVAAQLSTHLENLRLTAASDRALADSQRRGEELAVINQVAQVVSQQLELESLLLSVYAQLKNVIALDGFHVGLYSPDTGLMDYPLMVTGTHREQLAQVPLHPNSNSYRVIHERTPVLRHLTAAEVAEIQASQPPTLLGTADEAVTASLIYVPLLRGETAIGVLSVQSYALNAYREDDLRLLSGVANYLTTAIQNAELFKQTQAALAQTEALYAGSDRIIRAATPDETLLALVDSSALQQADEVHVALFDRPWHAQPESLAVTAVWTAGGRAARLPRGAVFQLAQFPLRSLLDAAAPAFIADVTAAGDVDDALRAWLLANDMRSILVYPLVAGDQWFAIVTAFASTPIQVSEEDARRIRSLTDQAATVLQTQRLVEETRARARREQMLREISAQVFTAPSAEAILRKTASEVQRLLGLDTFVYLEDAAGEGKTNGRTTRSVPLDE